MGTSFLSEVVKAVRLDAAALIRMAADRLYKVANDVSWPAGYMEAPSSNVSHEWVPISVHFTRPTSWKFGPPSNEKQDVFYVDTDSRISVRDPIGKDAPSEDVESGVSAGAQYDLHLAKAADANAANDLRALMSRIGEDVWSAGWLMGLEFRLWRDIIAAESDDDERGIFYHDREALLTLAKKAGGWWLWDEELFCERFVPLTEWNALYADHERKASV